MFEEDRPFTLEEYVELRRRFDPKYPYDPTINADSSLTFVVAELLHQGYRPVLSIVPHDFHRRVVEAGLPDGYYFEQKPRRVRRRRGRGGE
jgi:hypothetical protein